MQLEKLTSEDQLNENDEYLVLLRDYVGETIWTVMYFRNGVVTEHPSGGDLRLTWEILQKGNGGQIYKLPYHGDD